MGKPDWLDLKNYEFIYQLEPIDQMALFSMRVNLINSCYDENFEYYDQINNHASKMRWVEVCQNIQHGVPFSESCIRLIEHWKTPNNSITTFPIEKQS